MLIQLNTPGNWAEKGLACDVPKVKVDLNGIFAVYLDILSFKNVHK